MDNSQPGLQKDPEYQEYLEYLQYVKGVQAQRQQNSGPQPFKVTENQDKASVSQTGKTPLQNYQDSQLAVAEKLAPSFGSFTKGLVETGSLGNIKVPNKSGLPESPASEMGGKLAGAIAQAVPASKLMSSLPGAGNAIGRIAGSSALGAAEGALKAPDEGQDRASNAQKGAAVGLGAGVLGEGLGALLGAGKSVINAVRPGSDTEQRQGLQELLSGRTTQVDPSKLKVSPDLTQELQGMEAERALAGRSNPGAASGEVEAPLEWLNKARGALDKVSHSPTTGLPLPKSADEYAAANYLRDKLHSESPEIDKAFTELSSNIKAKQYLDDAKKALLKEGKVGKAATKATLGLTGAATRGATQSLGKFGGTGLDSLLSLLSNE